MYKKSVRFAVLLVAGNCKVFAEVNENKWPHGRKTKHDPTSVPPALTPILRVFAKLYT